MSAPINNGGPAFPQAGHTLPNGTYEWPVEGMSLRDYFAGQALAGFMAVNGPISPVHDSKICYEMADAMLEARNRKGGQA